MTEGPTAKNPNTRQGAARQVNTTNSGEPPLEWNPRLLECLYSSDSEETAGAVREVRVNYRGSQPQYAPVLLQGVPARGVIDSGADITIVGGDLFRQ